MKFFQLLKLLSAGMKIGPPPDVNDEPAFKQWIIVVLAFLADLATATTTDADDRVVATLEKLTANYTYWRLFYSILKAAIEYVKPEDESLLVGRNDVRVLAEEVKIDPFTLIAIIQAVLQAFEWFRNRRAG